VDFYAEREPRVPGAGDTVTFLVKEEGEIVGEAILEVVSSDADGKIHVVQASPYLEHRPPTSDAEG
jgi:hypothetical protein